MKHRNPVAAMCSLTFIHILHLFYLCCPVKKLRSFGPEIKHQMDGNYSSLHPGQPPTSGLLGSEHPAWLTFALLILQDEA